MKIIDLHCDTLTKLGENERAGLRINKFSVDLERLKSSSYMAQFFALFIDKEEHDAYDWALHLADIFKYELANNCDLAKQAYNYMDIIENDRQGIVSCLLTIEEGAALRGSMENLKKFYDMGVRIITLTWNYPNEIGYPNCMMEHQNKGLTEFGHDLLDEMNRLGIIIDVSHLSDKGFYDVAQSSKVPFVASHSNARSITGHPRNLTDDMIRKLAELGGITGINFFAGFLGTEAVSTVENMVKHIRHIYNTGGSEVLALGSDFDGISSRVEFGGCSGMEVLFHNLKKNGFSETDLDKIFYGNALRVIKDVLK
ncbi:MAG: dipeptidase [Bacillota bacterium]|nr:dipeptidase [Bacillota bacterium]